MPIDALKKYAEDLTEKKRAFDKLNNVNIASPLIKKEEPAKNDQKNQVKNVIGESSMTQCPDKKFAFIYESICPNDVETYQFEELRAIRHEEKRIEERKQKELMEKEYEQKYLKEINELKSKLVFDF